MHVSQVQQIYRTNVLSHICVLLNSCLSVALGVVIWLVYEPSQDVATTRTILYGVVGGLELWLVFFANVLLLVGKARLVRPSALSVM